MAPQGASSFRIREGAIPYDDHVNRPDPLRPKCRRHDFLGDETTHRKWVHFVALAFAFPSRSKWGTDFLVGDGARSVPWLLELSPKWMTRSGIRG
jgi:hypothetical protein